MVKKNAVASAASTEEQVEEKLCGCGCGQVVSPKRTFRPGHDAKLRSALLAAWDDGQGAVAEELVTRGWYTWDQLQERQAKRDEKAAKKARRATKAQVPTTSAEVKDSTTENAGEVSE